ncbi:transcriptional regulator BetI [compost metagenome]
MRSNSRRDLILIATAKVIRDLGADNLTIDLVAKEAGVSKGGVLHHFPNKQALINAMVEESTAHFFDDLRQRVSNETQQDAGKWSRAYLETTVSYDRENKGMNESIIATLTMNPDLISIYQKEYEIIQKNIENDGIDPVHSTIIRLAMDGLWFSEILGIGNLNDHLRTKVFEYLINMTYKNE